MATIDQIKKDVLPKAESFMRETFGLDGSFELGSFKVTEKSVVVIMSGSRGIEINGKIPLSLLYPPQTSHPDQTAMFEGSMNPGEKADMATQHVDQDQPAAPPCDKCEFFGEKLDEETDEPVRDGDGKIIMACGLIYGEGGEPCGAGNGYQDFSGTEEQAPEPSKDRCCENCLYRGPTLSPEDGDPTCMLDIPEDETCDADNGFPYFESAEDDGADEDPGSDATEDAPEYNETGSPEETEDE